MYHLFLGLDYLIGLVLVIMEVHLDLQAMDRDWSRQSQITFPINCFFQNSFSKSIAFFKTDKVQVSFHHYYFFTSVYALPGKSTGEMGSKWAKFNNFPMPGNYSIQAEQSGNSLARKKFPVEN